jgi:tRNA nucleotidyltransferase/poly(A) polymerase
MNSKEKILEMMEEIKENHPNKNKYFHWKTLMNSAKEKAKEEGRADILISFFRYALLNSEEMKSYAEWNQKMKRGLSACIRIVQMDDQARAAGISRNEISNMYELL